jgi:hypothetical protein
MFGGLDPETHLIIGILGIDPGDLYLSQQFSIRHVQIESTSPYAQRVTLLRPTSTSTT